MSCVAKWRGVQLDAVSPPVSWGLAVVLASLEGSGRGGGIGVVTADTGVVGAMVVLESTDDNDMALSTLTWSPVLSGSRHPLGLLGRVNVSGAETPTIVSGATSVATETSGADGSAGSAVGGCGGWEPAGSGGEGTGEP